MKTVYEYAYFTQMDSNHWLCYALDGTDLGEIRYSLLCRCYVYDQSIEIATSITGLEEVLDFMKQL